VKTNLGWLAYVASGPICVSFNFDGENVALFCLMKLILLNYWVGIRSVLASVHQGLY